MKIKPLNQRLAWLFKKWIVVRPKGMCQILFSLTELDDFIEEIVEEIISKLPESENEYHSDCVNDYKKDVINYLKSEKTLSEGGKITL